MNKERGQIDLNGDVYDLHEELGKGTFAVCFRGVNSKSKKSYAIKIVLTGTKTVERECQALIHCGIHPFIIQFYTHGYITQESKNVPVLLFEQAVNGDIFQVIRNVKIGLPEIVCRTYLYQLFTALKHLHARGIYHRDIKVENLLLDHNYNLKLADFGLAHFSKEDESLNSVNKSDWVFPFSQLVGNFLGESIKHECLIEGDVGTTPYAAPEIFTLEKYLGSKVDVWSSGCALFVMLLCCPPFVKPMRNKCQLFDLVADGKFIYYWSIFEEGQNILSFEVKDLFMNIFQVEPSCRYTVSDVFKHKWMQMKMLAPGELKLKMLDITNKSVTKKRSRSSE